MNCEERGLRISDRGPRTADGGLWTVDCGRGPESHLQTPRVPAPDSQGPAVCPSSPVPVSRGPPVHRFSPDSPYLPAVDFTLCPLFAKLLHATA